MMMIIISITITLRSKYIFDGSGQAADPNHYQGHMYQTIPSNRLSRAVCLGNYVARVLLLKHCSTVNL